MLYLLQGDPDAGPGALGGGMNLGGMDIGSLLNNPTLMNMVGSLETILRLLIYFAMQNCCKMKDTEHQHCKISNPF